MKRTEGNKADGKYDDCTDLMLVSLLTYTRLNTLARYPSLGA